MRGISRCPTFLSVAFIALRTRSLLMMLAVYRLSTSSALLDPLQRHAIVVSQRRRDLDNAFNATTDVSTRGRLLSQT